MSSFNSQYPFVRSIDYKMEQQNVFQTKWLFNMMLISDVVIQYPFIRSIDYDCAEDQT